MQPTEVQMINRAELNIRAARPHDRAALEAMAARIWEGEDYLPRVLDAWLGDPHGGFYVALLGERLVGAIKLTRLGEEEWWLEGLRVDPAYQGHGIGRILHHFALKQVRERGRGVVRFSTASDNDAVVTLARETGFERVGTYVPYRATALNEPVQAVFALGPDDTARVQAYLDTSAYFGRAQRSLEWDWSFLYLNADRLAARLAEGLVYGWPRAGDRDRLAGVIVTNPVAETRWPGDPILKLAYFDVPADQVTAAALDLRRLAGSLERLAVRYKALQEPGRQAVLEAAGYVLEWEFEVWLYARAVRLTEHADVRLEELPPLGE